MKVIKNYINSLIKNFSSDKIVAKNKKHLKKLIQKEIKLHGNQCNLNHIDVSNITNMSQLFLNSEFNGNISEWDVSHVINMNRMFKDSKFDTDISMWDTSNVTDMGFMFYKSNFNGDISHWDTSNVEDMTSMFCCSNFNGDISKWNVSKVENMYYMFYSSKFNRDLSDWKPYKLEINDIFDEKYSNIPYWHEFDTEDERNRAIDSYSLNKELEKTLIVNETKKKKTKI